MAQGVGCHSLKSLAPPLFYTVAVAQDIKRHTHTYIYILYKRSESKVQLSKHPKRSIFLMMKRTRSKDATRGSWPYY